MQLFPTTGTYLGTSNPLRYAELSTVLSGWKNTQKGSASNLVEVYGTSWMYDLMTAKQYSNTGLVQENSTFRGATDANHSYTPGAHGSHDLGMALDLSISRFGESMMTDISKGDKADINLPSFPAGTSWITKALAYVGLLTEKDGYKEQSMLRDFLSLYAITIDDGITGNGTWDDLPIKNEEAVRKAIFGGGTPATSLISKVLIGGDYRYYKIVNKEKVWYTVPKNHYPNIGKILSALGIGSGTASNHFNPFHIYLRPPEPEAITSSHGLLASEMDFTSHEVVEDQVLMQQVLDILNGGIMMFPVEMPYAPEEQAAAVIVADAGMAKQFDFILKDCKAIPTDPDSNPKTYKDGHGATHWNAEYFINPAGKLWAYLQIRDRRAITDMSVFKNVVMLEAPKHGHIRLMNEDELDGADNPFFHFTPTPGYVGKDKAVFAVEYQGKRYRVDVELILVSSVMDEGCAARLIKIKKSATVTSVSEAGYPDLANWYQNLSLQALLTGVKDALIGFTDLPGASLGQTTGDKITLDADAAGYGWFIDTTPYLNEEWLPTSNPLEWKAKPGSEAEGKMDLLSVLLHEYGHVLASPGLPTIHRQSLERHPPNTPSPPTQP
jgi:hypothetical protein